MENTDCRQIRDAVIVIDRFIKEELYNLHPKTVEKWYDTKTEIDRIVLEKTGKSVYGIWE